ncbi:MAG: hypothetical protein ACK55I_29490, partial [bacterium]
LRMPRMGHACSARRVRGGGDPGMAVVPSRDGNGYAVPGFKARLAAAAGPRKRNGRPNGRPFDDRARTRGEEGISPSSCREWRSAC